MGVLDEVMQMQNQGRDEEDITQELKEKGVSPREIQDAINQAKIKSAVYAQDPYTPQTPQASQSENYTPQIQEMQEQEYIPQETQYQEPYQESYENYSPGGIDTDTMVEIAEQVFQEKITPLQNNIQTLNEFRTITQSTVENLAERVKKIETMIDRLQIAVLQKVGSYGENLESIKKEMSMMQDSFGKMINTVADNSTRKQANPFAPETPMRKKVSKKV